eukprot:13802647-Alexandrium_andersonii.AAC.1
MSASLVGSEMCIRDSPGEDEQEAARNAANCLQRCYVYCGTLGAGRLCHGELRLSPIPKVRNEGRLA